MLLKFRKYHGAGNDFVMLDNRNQQYSELTTEQIHFLCTRRFGIGADGLIMIENVDGYHFGMKYYNSDGRQGTMCGNGGRCAAAYAQDIGIKGQKLHFLASDGPHDAIFEANGNIRLKMMNTGNAQNTLDGLFINTGSPHYVQFVEKADEIDVATSGKEIRQHKAFAPDGCNVNFVEQTVTGLKVRTFERGVEAETFACGTGAVAAALCAGIKANFNFTETSIEMPGGSLHVSFEHHNGQFTNVWLTGPALTVFDGEIAVS